MSNKEEYNDIPVHFCRSCLSLAIMRMESEIPVDEYCNKCTSTDIGVATLDEWDAMYEKKYKVKFINTKRVKNGEERDR